MSEELQATAVNDSSYTAVVPEFTRFRLTAQDRANLLTIAAFLAARPERRTRKRGQPGVGMSDALRYAAERVARSIRSGKRPR